MSWLARLRRGRALLREAVALDACADFEAGRAKEFWAAAGRGAWIAKRHGPYRPGDYGHDQWAAGLMEDALKREDDADALRRAARSKREEAGRL